MYKNTKKALEIILKEEYDKENVDNTVWKRCQEG